MMDPENINVSECIEIELLDALPHHACFNWNDSQIECEVEWPCEVRQYLFSISPLITIARFLLSYGTLLIILWGIFLNILCFYTLISSGLSKKGSGIYLVSLAICDIGNLVTNYGIGIARAHLSGVNDIFMGSEWLCRSHAVFVEIFQLMSAWIVVGFTVERCIAIWYPILFRHTSRTARAKKVISGLSLLITLFSLLKLFLTGFEGDSVFGYMACQSSRYRWRGMVFVWVAFETWIPATVVFVFNLFMFCKLREILRARRQLSEYRRDGRKKCNFINRPSTTAPMLVAVSLAYLMLVFPLGVIQTVELFWNLRNQQPEYTLEDDDEMGKNEFIMWKNTKLLLKYLRSLFFAFYQLNFCINFFLYFVTGVQFRTHLKTKCKCFVSKCFGRNGFSCGGFVKERSHLPQIAVVWVAECRPEGSPATERSVVMDGT